ncbi:response regulator [bacterium]|nr:response regulator [bacterium]
MKWRILLVDDEPDIRLIVRTTLEKDYEILEAHDGLDALEKIKRYEPDFVLMDVMMPLMNGFEACAAIRNDPKFRDLPVMFLSALGSKDDMKKGFGSGANYYLTKPFDPTRLQKNIDVFFQTTPPARRPRRFTIDQIREFEASGHIPAAPGSSDYVPSSEAIGFQPTRASGVQKIPEAVPTTEPLFPRVMVVDDDPAILDMIRMSLEGIAEVVTASDGMAAIEKLVKYQPDILMIDIMLPRMNGFQLTQSLRANRAFARLPILMCSAKSAERDVLFAKRVGANDYLAKPFSPADVMAKIRDMQKLPGFIIRPKSLSIQQISDLEATRKKADVFEDEEEARTKDEHEAKRNKTAMAKFVQQEGNKDALEKESAHPEPKKRRFFGFSRDD